MVERGLGGGERERGSLGSLEERDLRSWDRFEEKFANGLLFWTCVVLAVVNCS